ncbi:hypothetical protein [Brucella intermedia]|uniref:hypothetical protein n=1 Tax=Brucella intermedia TaxID=94625 RepID=UPI002362C50F|nr:hypothetical protein [Brucella intermedia]
MAVEQQIKFLGNLSRLDTRPGDKFVLMTEGDVPHDMAMRITEEWKRFMGPDAPKLMILSDGIKIGVVSGLPDCDRPNDPPADWNNSIG